MIERNSMGTWTVEAPGGPIYEGTEADALARAKDLETRPRCSAEGCECPLWPADGETCWYHREVEE